MLPPDSEDPREQPDRLVRPYMRAGGQHGAEPGDVTANRAGAGAGDGDVLAEGWGRDGAAQGQRGHVDQPDHRDDWDGDPDRETEIREARLTADDDEVFDVRPWRRREHTEHTEHTGHSEHGVPGGEGGGSTGFLGSGWREDDDYDEVRPRRKNVLLGAGVAVVAVAGAVFGLVALIGQPSPSACPGGTGCAAEAHTPSPKVSAPHGGTVAPDPGAPESPEATPSPIVTPKATPVVRRTHPAATSTARPVVTRRPTVRHSEVPVTTEPTVTAEEPGGAEEQPATTAPTTAPATVPTQDPPKHSGGLFGWLF